MLRAKKSQPENHCVPKERPRTIGEAATEEKTVGWHHPLIGHEVEQALGDGGGQETCCVSVHGVAKSWTRLSNWKTTNKTDTKTHPITVTRVWQVCLHFLCDHWQLSSPLPFWPTSGQTDEDGPSLPALALAGHSNHARPQLCGRTVLLCPHPKHNKTPSQPPSLLPPDIAGPVGSLSCSPQKATWCE